MHTKELKQMEDLLLVRKKALLLEVEERLKKYKDANNEKITDVAEIASSVSNEELEILIAEEDARKKFGFLLVLEKKKFELRSGKELTKFFSFFQGFF